MRLHPIRTPFDLVIVLFGVTAGVGVWASYDRDTAWARFGLALAAIAIYFVVSWARQRTLWAAAGLLGVIGGGYTLLFLLGHNWQMQPADLGVVQRLALAWMNIRPPLPVGDPGQNITGGVVAAVLPLYAAFAWRLWREAKAWQRLLAAGLLVLLLAGLLMSSSRAAWLALAAGLAGWTAWQGSLWLAQRRGWRPALALVVPALLFITAAIAVWIASNGGLATWGRAIPGEESASSRLQIARGALYLAAETPFTGGGLATFPGLYSEYIRRIRVFEYGYAHNLYLDVAVEQGVFGVAALVVIFAGSLALLAIQVTHTAEAEGRLFGLATFASLATICLHGLADNALYGMSSSAWLFAAPGMAAALWAGAPHRGHATLRLRGWLFPVGAAAALGAAFLLLVPGNSLPAAWRANLGAVAMARIQLAGFPDQRLPNEQTLAALGPAQTQFEQALQFEATNPTANYRLGLIALEGGDFPTAIRFLENALAGMPDHGGVRKSLGYAYLWNLQGEQAAKLLAAFPEIPVELDAYAYWWGTQNRSDLAAIAVQFATRLRGR